MCRSPWLLLALLLTTATAQAQIEPSSPAQQRAANRRALREARRTDSPYKDSHLGVTRQQLKRGSSVPVQAGTEEPRFDGASPLPATEPKHPGLRLRKAKGDSPR